MKKRIALISEHASPLADLGSVDSGGQNVYVAHVARLLARMGYVVDIFTRRANESAPGIVLWDAGVRVIHVPAGPATFIRKEELLPHMPEFTNFIIQFSQRQGQSYDLIHANFWMSGLVAADIKRTLGIPFVVTFHALGRVRRLHQGEADGFPEIRFVIEDRIVSEADRIIAECPQDQHDLQCLYQADPNKVSVVPCGFDPEEVWPLDKTLSRRALNLPENERLVLQLGRMVPRKGVDTVVQGFARLLKTHKIPARLVIVGGESDEPDPELTPEIGRLQGIAAAEGIADRVTFTGRRGRNAIKHFYSAADVFVSTPWYEPFGITPVEAMACGTPVIGSKVGGIQFTVRDGETGYLIPPNDPDSLGERLAHLYKNPSLLKRFSQQAIQRANSLFTWEKVAGSIAVLYEGVFDAGRLAEIQIGAADGSKGVGSGSQDSLSLVERGFEKALQVLRRSRRVLGPAVLEAANTLANCLARGGKIMICGNGGSAADAQHFAAEFVGRFLLSDRKALPVLALNADTAFLTAWANDIGYEAVFSRQVEAFGKAGDVLLGISTSGQSRNLIEAFKTAHGLGITCLALLGGKGGELSSLADQAVIVPSAETPRIQEIHLFILHMLAELVESNMIAGRFLPVSEMEASMSQNSQHRWELQSGLSVPARSNHPGN